MQDLTISDSITFIGVNDKTLDLFENQYQLTRGVSYNSYLILDEKTAVLDTVDARMTESWLENLEKALSGRTVDYLVISHMEPDHAANLQRLAQMYPEMKLVGNAKTFTLVNQFFQMDLTDRTVTVKEGDTLCLGSHTLQFFMAPMVHWPEVMVSYEQKEGIVFSADAFGKFSTLDIDEPWVDEARRYYFNIVGKYGMQTQGLLKKLAGLKVNMICPLHGPILRDPAYYIGKYDLWSRYQPEEKGIFIAYASIYGHTAQAAHQLADILKTRGESTVELMDLTHTDVSFAVAQAFRYDRLVVAASSHDAGLFPPMEEFLLHLQTKAFQQRTVAIMENGSWAPSAGKCMKALLTCMKQITLIEPLVSIRSSVKPETVVAMEELADKLLG